MTGKKICYTSLVRNIIFGVVALLIISLSILLFAFMITREPELLDSKRTVGTPGELPEEYGYSVYSATDICDIAICGAPDIIDGKEVKLYLTNPETNDLYIRAEIYTVKFTYNENGEITAAEPDKLIGKSGFICPGEYVESLTLKKRLSKEQTPVMIKIATYSPDDETSRGFFYINTTLVK